MRRTREWGMATTSASVVRGCRMVAGAHELMNYFFSSFSLRVFHTYGCVMLVKVILLLSCLTTAKGRGGTAHIHIIFSFSPTSPENTRRIRRGSGNYLRESPKTSCSQLPSLVLSGMHGPRGWVVVGAEVLHSGRNARRTREWGVATSSASAMIGCRTVAVTHDLMKIFLLLIFSVRALQFWICDVCHGHFVALLSQHSKGERGHGPRLRHFLSQSDLMGKHPSDPTGLPQLPLRELKNLLFTTFVVGALRFACATRLGTSGAEVLQSGLHARRTREWGVATSSALAVRGCRTVTAPHEVMTFFFLHFVCEFAALVAM